MKSVEALRELAAKWPQPSEYPCRAKSYLRGYSPHEPGLVNPRICGRCGVALRRTTFEENKELIARCQSPLNRRGKHECDESQGR